MSDDDISMVRGAPQLPLAPSPGISNYREKAGSRSERRSWNNWPPLGGAPARMRPAHIHFHTRRLKPSPWESGSHETCMGLFLSSGCFWVLLPVLCSERERPFFIPSPAIRFPERAEGVKGPKR